MPFFGRSRDDNLKTYIGFAAMSSVVLTIVGLSVDVYVRELRGMMLGVVAIALLLGILYRAGIRYWVALACGVLTSALIVFGGAGEVAWHDAPAMLGVVLSINLLLMLYAFRTHPSCYVGLAAAVGAMIGIASTNFWVGLVAFTAFIITLAADYCAQCSDLEFCALIEHELYHLAHATDKYGQPAFTQDGAPKIKLQGHDVEEFVGVVRRYGASPDVQALVDAANNPADVGKLNIARACGTCLLKSA